MVSYIIIDRHFAQNLYNGLDYRADLANPANAGYVILNSQARRNYPSEPLTQDLRKCLQIALSEVLRASARGFLEQ